MCPSIHTHRQDLETAARAQDGVWVMKEGPGLTLSTDKDTAWSSRPSTGAALVGAGGTVNLAASALSLQWGLVSMEGDTQRVKPSGASVPRVFRDPDVNMNPRSSS